MTSTRLKTIFKRFTIFLTLLIIVCFVGVFKWIFQEKTLLEEKLTQKKFISPSEFYYYPLIFEKSQIIDLKKMDADLLALSYRKRNPTDTIKELDYFLSNADACDQWIPKREEEEFCLLLNDEAKKIIYLNEQGRVLRIFVDNVEVPYTYSRPKLLAQYLNQDPIMQENIELSEITPYCMNAIMAIEDPQFLDHQGISPKSILRALVKNIIAGRKAQGGSTLTQQMVKNYLLTSEKTYGRKVRELILSLLIEFQMTKDEILETYMNIIYMGQSGAFQVLGYGSASQYYFQKSFKNLKLSECALLAAIINNPGMYNPFKNPTKARARRQIVLNKMQEHHLITEEEKKVAENESLPSSALQIPSETAPYYISTVQRQAEILGIPIKGNKVFTAMNMDEQMMAQKAVQSHLNELERIHPKIKNLKEKKLYLEGALLSSHHTVGLITAVVGGRSYRESQFNRAIDGHRQVGSIIKPFVYLTALKQNKSANDVILDEPFTVKYDGQTWSPENYDKKYHGDISLVDALKLSLNAATARLAQQVGLNEVVKTLRNFKVSSPLMPVPSMSLGAFEMYPMEVLKAYAGLAQMGKMSELSTIIRIEDHANRVLYEHKNQEEQVEDSVAVEKLVEMMKEIVRSGTAAIIGSHTMFSSAGKTGTTNDYKDAWYAGFTSEKTTVVWVGYDNNTPSGLTGASGAVPIWLHFMKQSQSF